MTRGGRSGSDDGDEGSSARPSIDVIRFRERRSQAGLQPIQASALSKPHESDKPVVLPTARRRSREAVEAQDVTRQLDPRSDDYVPARCAQSMSEKGREAAESSAVDSSVESQGEKLLEPALVAKLRAIDDLFARLDGATHYRVLGLETNASGKEVRAAYFSLAKRFHPDVFFRRDIGGYRRKLETVFDAMTRAYETLRRPASRAEYDDSIGVLVHQRFVAPVRRSLLPGSVESESSRVEREVRRLSLLPEGPFQEAAPYVQIGKLAPGRAEPNAAPSSSERAARAPRPSNQATPTEVTRARLSRPNGPSAEASPRPNMPQGASDWTPSTQLRDLEKLRQQRPLSSAPVSGVNRRPSAPNPEGARQSAPESAVPTLIAIGLDLHGGTGLQNWASMRVREAHQEETAGRIANAANILRIVLRQYADSRIAAHKERLARLSVRKTLPEHRSRARNAEGKGQWREAAECWEAIIAVAPDDGEAFFSLGRCLLRAGDAKAAGRAAVRAAELNPRHIETRELLVEFFELMGMKLNARRERETLQKLLEARADDGRRKPGARTE